MCEIGAAVEHATPARGERSRKDRREGRFARTGCSNECDRLAFRNRQVDRREHNATVIAIGVRDAFDSNRPIHGCFLSRRSGGVDRGDDPHHTRKARRG